MAGGYDSSDTFLSSSEVYQYPGGEAWRAMVDLPSPRYALRSASLAGVFYLVGGEDGHGFDDILVYDISANTFILAGHLTTGRSEHAVAAVPWQAVAQYCHNTTEQSKVTNL